MYCDKCGKPIKEGSRFCGYCGSPVSEGTGNDISNYTQPVQQEYFSTLRLNIPESTRDLLKKIIYIAMTVIYVLAMALHWEEVADNLDGWHGLHSAFVGLFFAFGASMSMWCLILSGFLKIRKYNIVTACDQVLTPLIALIVLIIMKGNVDSTIGYLIFRVLEGFESIYVMPERHVELMDVLSAIRLMVLFCRVTVTWGQIWKNISHCLMENLFHRQDGYPAIQRVKTGI